MQLIALIDDTDVVERLLRHHVQSNPQPNTLTPAGLGPHLPRDETLPLTYHRLADIN